MPFGKKTNQQIETKEQFALVLNPLRGEMTKGRMTEKMVQVFPLTMEEARDLVENTPIILLEGLEREMGEQLRGYFIETGADLILTDDKSFKRRCFRAIWPSPPKIDFLKTEERISKEPAIAQLKEVRGEELVKLMTEDVKLPKEPISGLKPVETDSRDIWNKNKIEEIELTTANAINEEKITHLTQEKDKLQSLVLNLQKENDELKTEQVKALHVRKQLEEEKLELAKLEQVKIRLEADKKMLEGNLRQIEADRAVFMKARQNEAKLMEEHYRESEAKTKEDKARLEAQLSDLKSVNQNQKMQLERSNERIKVLSDELQLKEGELRAKESEAGKSIEEIKVLSDKLEGFEKEIEHEKKEFTSLLAESEELKRMVTEVENRLADRKKELEAARLELEKKVNETDSWRRKAEEWSHVYANLVKEAEGLKRKHEEDAAFLTTRNRELQNQLETAQKQLRDFALVAEQQDLVNKRNQIAAQLAEKEARFREIVRHHEVLQKGYEEQKQLLETTFSERETLEKEISKDRQAQKYVLEQLKLKEKARTQAQERMRPRNGNGTNGNSAEQHCGKAASGSQVQVSAPQNTLVEEPEIKESSV